MTINDSTRENLLDLPELADTPVSSGVAIASIALNMAMKYCDINTVQDGALYQVLKLEGRNMASLSLDHVFDVAKQIEIHLLNGSDRIAAIVVDALEHHVLDVPEVEEDQEPDKEE